MHDFVTFMAGYIAGLIAMIILDVIFRYAIESFKVSYRRKRDVIKLPPKTFGSNFEKTRDPPPGLIEFPENLEEEQ
ncbi:MAG: hypothetical protein J6L98_04285 [Bacteroidales bacterium]|nr:hypothetical protein [Bacteroidales bacterium]